MAVVFSQTSAEIRSAGPQHCASIARIYNQGIAERRSTFETEPRAPNEIRNWLISPREPVLVADVGNVVVGWARITSYSGRHCYAGVGEASVYIVVAQRGRGVGTALARELVAVAERAGYYKLLGKLFTDNDASRRLVRRLGFREVGVHLRHGRLDGHWRDVVLVELLLAAAAD